MQMTGCRRRILRISNPFLPVFAFATPCTHPEKEVGIQSLLNEMIDREAVAGFPGEDFRQKQESSYNRVSKSPNDTIGWFANCDKNPKDTDAGFILVEEKAGKKEWELMGHQGPGTIVRAWMPYRTLKKSTMDSFIKFHLDGSTEPVLKGNMSGLIGGTGFPPSPLSQHSLPSAVSFFPIPYAKSGKVRVSEHPFFYPFTYREYPEGTAVKTFTIEGYLNAFDDFLKINGEGIYGSRPWKILGEWPLEVKDGRLGENHKDYSQEDIRFTGKDGVLYAFVPAIPTRDIVIESLAKGGLPDSGISAIEPMGSDKKVKWKRTNDALTIKLPKYLPSNIVNGFRMKISNANN